VPEPSTPAEAAPRPQRRGRALSPLWTWPLDYGSFIDDAVDRPWGEEACELCEMNFAPPPRSEWEALFAFLQRTRRLYRVGRVVATYIFLRHTREFGAPPTDDGPMFDADDMCAIHDSVALATEYVEECNPLTAELRHFHSAILAELDAGAAAPSATEVVRRPAHKSGSRGHRAKTQKQHTTEARELRDHADIV
jgi:hypothetical protein